MYIYKMFIIFIARHFCDLRFFYFSIIASSSSPIIAPSIVIASSVSSGQIGPTYCVAPGQIHSGYISVRE